MGWGAATLRCEVCGIEKWTWLDVGFDGPAPDLVGCSRCGKFRILKHGQFKKCHLAPKCRRCNSRLYLICSSNDDEDETESRQACPKCDRALLRIFHNVIWD